MKRKGWTSPRRRPRDRGGRKMHGKDVRLRYNIYAVVNGYREQIEDLHPVESEERRAAMQALDRALKRSRGRCERCLWGTWWNLLSQTWYPGRQSVPARDLHHRLPRGRIGQDTEQNLTCLCRICHDWVTEHPAEATREGWTVSPKQAALQAIRQDLLTRLAVALEGRLRSQYHLMAVAIRRRR